MIESVASLFPLFLIHTDFLQSNHVLINPLPSSHPNPNSHPTPLPPPSVVHDGDITLEAVYEITRTMRPRSMARTFAMNVKEILGTCVSVGCTIDGECPRDMQENIDNGSLVPPTE